MKNKALTNAQNAVMNQVKKINHFDGTVDKNAASQDSFDTSFSLANPTLKKQLPQPKIFKGNLKSYQLKVTLSFLFKFKFFLFDFFLLYSEYSF